MKNFVQQGKFVTVTAPAGGLNAGDGVLVDHLFGVAANSALEGEQVEIATDGVFDLDKDAGASLTAGAPIYWDDTAKVVTTTATANLRIGTALEAAALAAATGRILITGHAI
ncbi:DUF2190 family protein [Stappia indica]|uniref:DUF2190 family protein n=1 Tax=Stappia indica TaxID=538381 RepID=UPI001CD3F60E|nr:DUF2190 family protein [Stappia indica]MCA1298508.1 DUF2190 family protein [Stappia indica]